MTRRRDESGQVVAAFAAVVTALLMLTALVVDLSPALVARLQQQESLSQAAQSCAAPASSLIVKNSEDPGGEIARQVASSMRESGFDGQVEVWFYEVPEGANAKVDQANRARPAERPARPRAGEDVGRGAPRKDPKGTLIMAFGRKQGGQAAPANGAERQAQGQKALSIVAAAACAVAVGGVGFGINAANQASAIQSKVSGGMQKVVVTTQEVKAGQTIDQSSISYADVPAAFRPDGAVSDAADLVGQAAVTDIPRNTVVTGGLATGPENAASLSRKLEPGTVGITVSVDSESAVAGLIGQGDTVTLYEAGEKDADGKQAWSPLLRGVKVVALDDKLGSETTAYATVTLQVTEEQAVRIMSAGGAGSGGGLKITLDNRQG